MATITTAQPSITSQFRGKPLRIDEQRIQPDPSFADPADERLCRKQQAAFLFITADATARAQLLAEAAGTPKLIRPEVAEPLGRSRAFGGFSFRPYYDEIVAEQPDLLD